MKRHLIKQNGRLLEVEMLSDNMAFPTSIAIDDKENNIYVAESGLAFDGTRKGVGGRVLKIGANGENHSVVIDQLKPPVTGLTFYQEALYFTEGGHPSQIVKIKPSDPQQKNVLLTNLPGPGNYHTNMVAFSPDSKMYFSQGAMTNAAIIGLDSYELGWLRRVPHACDIPGYDITLIGANFETLDPRVTDTMQSRAVTGAFVPFATPTLSGQRIKGQILCTASIMRCDAADGNNLELVAWGLRNCFGLGFLKDGRLLATDQGPDDRGSRPIGNAPDFLYEIRKGSWYGWPDFIGGIPITDNRFTPKRGQMPTFIISNHEDMPPAEKPLLSFPTNSAPTKFDVAHGEGMGEWTDHIFVALFGDEKPMTAPSGPKVGRAISRIDPSDWSVHPFIEDRELFARPIDLRFENLTDDNTNNNIKGSLLVLDFGRFEIDRNRNVAGDAQSGKLWRVIL